MPKLFLSVKNNSQQPKTCCPLVLPIFMGGSPGEAVLAQPGNDALQTSQHIYLRGFYRTLRKIIYPEAAGSNIPH